MYLGLGLDQNTGVEFDDVLHKHGLDVCGEGGDLGVQEGIDGSPGVRQETAELSRDPGRRVEHLADPVLVGATREEMGVLKDGGL